MLQISHVTKRYGRFTANRDISLYLADGEIAVLLGPNGAGKSTLIKSIADCCALRGISRCAARTTSRWRPSACWAMCRSFRRSTTF